MNPKQIQAHNRKITDNQLGNNVTINQGDVHHYHASAPPQPRTPIRLIPYLQNKEFVDRRGLVDKLNVLLQQDSECFNDAALWGLGGSGKTQIALEYAYRRCKNPRCSIFWVHADTEASFIHDYKTIAALFGLGGILDGQELELLRAVSNRIQSQPQWLLVLDNADDLSLFGVGGIREGSSSLYDFVPKGTAVGTKGTVLWTSRDGQVAGSLVRSSRRAIKVSHMTSEEARKLLAMARGEDFEDDNDNNDNGDKDIEKLLEELQYLPLGISQAGAYMRRAETTVRGYLALLFNNEERWRLLEEEQFDIHRKAGVSNSILKIWSISIARIEQENFLSAELLRVMAYFDNRNIPYEMVDTAAQHISTTKLSSVEVRSAIIRLKEFSFISLREEGDGSQSYEMHKLVQEATQYAISTGQQIGQNNDPGESITYFARVAIQVTDSLFPNPLKEYAMHGGIKIGEERPDFFRRGEKYFPRVIKVLHWAEISKEDKRIWELVGRTWVCLRCLKRWEMGHLRMIESPLNRIDPNHTNTILSEQLIAKDYCALHRYSEAAEIENSVLKYLKSSLGEQNLYTLQSMHNVADIMCKCLQFRSAEKLQAYAIGILENLVDERVGRLMVESLHCLACAYYGQQNFNQVMEACVKSLMYCRDNLGADFQWCVTAAVRIIRLRGKTLIIQGRLQPQIATIIEDLVSEICEIIQAQTHLHEMTRMEMLVRINAAMGRHLKVVDMQVKVVEFYCKTLGEDHYRTIVSMAYLARLFHSLYRYSEAETLQVKVVKFFQEKVGEEHHYTISNMINLARIYYVQHRIEESEVIEQKVLRHCSKAALSLRFFPDMENSNANIPINLGGEFGGFQTEYFESLSH
ncbi:hypothetical protein GGI43DRAFT_151753 [Trichoderma evansii]